MNLNPSDRKKLLALPFYMAKRHQLPEPRRGQPEYDLFKQIYGREWDEDRVTTIDNEKKITEFDYEKFIHPSLLNQ
jgi:hypothetical protein